MKNQENNNQPQHTKGEWKASKISRSGFITINTNPNTDDRLIVDIMVHKGLEEEAEANARLIAAAPDMLEALKTCATLLEQLQFPGTEAIVLEAIAKAEGKSKG